MAKAYTDLAQSKLLAEFLPLDSADMEYILEQWIDEKTGRHKEGYYEIPVVKVDDDCPLQPITHPCWSLAGLFEIIPVTIERADNRCRLRIDKSEKDFDIWYEEVDSGLAQLDLDIITPNIVDACVEMIEKLHNEKLL